MRDGFFDRNASFAGVADPFRDEAELSEIHNAYEVLSYEVRGSPSDFTILRRRL